MEQDRRLSWLTLRWVAACGLVSFLILTLYLLTVWAALEIADQRTDRGRNSASLSQNPLSDFQADFKGSSDDRPNSQIGGLSIADRPPPASGLSADGSAGMIAGLWAQLNEVQRRLIMLLSLAAVVILACAWLSVSLL